MNRKEEIDYHTEVATGAFIILASIFAGVDIYNHNFPTVGVILGTLALLTFIGGRVTVAHIERWERKIKRMRRNSW